MNRPVFAVLLCSCVLLFGFAAVPGSVAGQDGTAERSLNTTTVSPGETVKVTVTADLNGTAGVDFADAWEPAAAATSIVSVSFDRGGLGVTSTEEVALFSEGEVTADSVKIVYILSVPADAEPGTVYEWVSAQNGDGSFLSVGDDNRPINGDQSFEVAGADGDDGDGRTDDENNGTGGDGESDGDDESNGGDGGSDGGDGDSQTDDGDNESGDGSGPGFGLVAVVIGVALLSVYLTRQSEST